MAVIQPASQFACGCTVVFGVQFILVAHLLRNLFFVFTAFLSVFAGSQAFSFLGGASAQTTWACFALAGIPLILLALHGVRQRHEVPIRLYLYYMFITFLVDEFFVVQQLVISGPCEHLPGVVAQNGAAFACGVARIVNAFLIFMVNVAELYGIYVVWSHCEDLAAGGGGADFHDLMTNEDAEKARLKLLSDYLGQGAVDSYQTYGIISDDSIPEGMGSSKIYGNHHEMQYPPPSRAAKNMNF